MGKACGAMGMNGREGVARFDWARRARRGVLGPADRGVVGRDE